MPDTATSVTVRTYRAPAVSGAPRLQGMPGIAEIRGPNEQSVEVFFHDTEDLRLARAGVSLQRLSGTQPGEPFEWLAELPGEREPLRVPSDDDAQQVPQAVLARVGEHSGGHQLLPVAHTQTTITRWDLVDADTVVRARLTAHAVSAQTLGASSTVDSWYWIALEFDAPDPALLGALEARLDDVGAMRAAPALPMRRLFADRLDGLKPSSRRRVELAKKATAAETVCTALGAHVRALHDLDAPVRRAEPDAVHQMRVATRRLRATLRAFGKVVDRDATADLHAELRWLSGVLAEARDQEVVQQRIEDLLYDTPADQVLGPIGAQLTRQFAREQAEAHARVLDALDTDRYATLLDALQRLVTDPPLTPLASRRGRDVLPGMVGKAVGRVDRAMAAVDQAPEGPERDAALHEVRKAARRVRYAAETVVPLLGGDARRTAKRFEQLGDVLGDHHDTVRTRAVLRTLGAQGHVEGHNGFTFGLWHEREAHTAQQIEAQLPAVWRAASRGKQRRWMS